MKCKQCNKETDNPKFCSQSCAATFNNKGIVRNGKSRNYVCDCGEKKDHRAISCHSCKVKRTTEQALSKPISEWFLVDRDARVRYNQIRHWARRLMVERGIEKKCGCGYDKHVECCHIISIPDFPEDTPLGIVNGEDNLIYLCRNCHWEQHNT